MQIISRMEMEYLTRTEFAGLDEQELVRKQLDIKMVLEQESIINQHAALYEILLHRYLQGGTTRSTREISALNDLLLRSISWFPAAALVL